jgi:hypothetical protein
VSGATRFQQTGAAIFLPFERHSSPERQRVLGLTDDHFVLAGFQLGSGFGYALEVLDLDNNGCALVKIPFKIDLNKIIFFNII